MHEVSLRYDIDLEHPIRVTDMGWVEHEGRPAAVPIVSRASIGHFECEMRLSTEEDGAWQQTVAGARTKQARALALIVKGQEPTSRPRTKQLSTGVRDVTEPRLWFDTIEPAYERAAAEALTRYFSF